MNCTDVVSTLPHVPPSVKTVLCTLYENKPMTGQELRDETGLPRRTVYAALHRLKELGILKERPSLKDTRQSYFWLSVGPQPEEPAITRRPIVSPAAPRPMPSFARSS